MSVLISADLKFRFKGELYVVERVRQSAQSFMSYCVKSGVERNFTYQQFFDLRAKGEVKLEPGHVPSPKELGLETENRSDLFHTDDEKKEISRRKSYVEAILKDGKLISGTKNQARAIAVHGREIGESDEDWPSARTVIRWLDRLKASLWNPNSLLRRKPLSRRHRDRQELLVQEKTQELFEKLYQNLYLRGEKCSVLELREAMRKKIDLDPYFSFARLPGKSTLYRWIKQRSEFEKTLGKKGLMVANQQYPSGRPVEEPTYINQDWELDHTQLDIIVVDEETGEAIGRPWLTAFIDRYTRMIVGFYVSMDAPCANTVLKAFRHAVNSKSYIKDVYGDRIESEWPNLGLPDRVITDNGADLTALKVEDALNLFCDPLYLPKGSPQFKGRIERFFRTLNEQLFHNKSGTTFSNYVKKGPYKSEENAVFTLDQVVFMIHKWVVDDYHVRTHSTLGKSPLQFWKDNLDDMPPLRMPDDATSIDQLLWKKGTKKLQKYGIEHACLRYQSPSLMKIAQQHGFKTEVDVLIDEDDLSVIRVILPGTESSIDVPCTRLKYVQERLSLNEHKRIRARAKAKLKESEKESESLLIRTREVLKAEEEEARNSTNKARRKFGRKKKASNSETATGTAAPNLSASVQAEATTDIENFDFDSIAEMGDLHVA